MYGPSPAERIATARRLLARNKVQEALDLINEAVRQDPRHPDSFECRAEIFEIMGMYPHAQADRRKAADLRSAMGGAPPPPQPQAPVPTPTPTPPPPPAEAPTATEPPQEPQAEAEAGEPDTVAEVLEGAGIDETSPPLPPPAPQPAPVVPAYMGPQRPSVSGALLRAAAVVLFALGVFIAAGVGIYMALDALQGDDSPVVGGTATPTTAADETDNPDGGGDAGNGGEPGTVEDALRGDPYGFSSVQAAWEGAGFTVEVGDLSESVTGFSEQAVDITVSRDGLAMEMSVLMYDSESAPETDWNLGVPPAPKLEGVVPVGSSVWYNQNVVVVVRVNDDSLRPDALDAFLDIG